MSKDDKKTKKLEFYACIVVLQNLLNEYENICDTEKKQQMKSVIDNLNRIWDIWSEL